MRWQRGGGEVGGGGNDAAAGDGNNDDAVEVHDYDRGCTGEFSYAKAKKVLVPRRQNTQNKII